jgi:hypothetical protein
LPPAFTLVSCFYPKVGGNTFLLNVGKLSTDYMALYLRRQHFITTAVRTSNPTTLYTVLIFYWENKNLHVRFEVFTAVTMKNAVFWDVAPCRYCVNRHFGGTYRLHLQGRKICEQGTRVSRWLQTFFKKLTSTHRNEPTASLLIQEEIL